MIALAPGTRLGNYEILSEIGQGGMGTVYKARDTRLDRLLAVKVLKDQSPELRERFEREARVVAALQHPHICTLYDIGTHDGVDYLVMEYLDGQTLRCPQPLAKTLEYGRQLADALHAAHRQGLTHRDVKPANIMITATGAKLLDFGIAKWSSGLSLAASAGTRSITSPGTVIGSLNYMAPEQLEGEPADARSDVWAFGTVMYEMVTGQRAFGGKSTASVIAAVMGHEPPDVSSVQRLAPPALDRLIRRCLAKDPDDRWQSMRDLALELASIQEIEDAATASRRPWLWPSLAAITLLSLAAVVGAWLMTPVSRAFQVSIAPPPNSTFSHPEVGVGGSAISPDGSMLAFVAGSQGKNHQLWIRALDNLEARVLPETDGAYYPFWSPDSRWIGYFSGGAMKKIAATGGPPQAICSVKSAKGGTWNRDDVILFSAVSTDRAIFRVSATGGTPSPVTKLNAPGQEDAHYWPHFLPGGRTFLFMNRLVEREKTSIVAASLDAPEQRHPVARSQTNAVFASGHVLFLHERTLMARPFDERSLVSSGEAFPVAAPVAYLAGTGLAEFSVSAHGALVYGSGSQARRRLVWRDRRGVAAGVVGSSGAYINPRLSPNGRRLALTRVDGGNYDLWLADLDRNAFIRMTFDVSFESNPTWSPDGGILTFTSTKNLYERSASGAGPVTQLTAGQLFQHPQDWSSDGRYLLFSEMGETTGADIMILEHNSDKADVFLRTVFSERHPQFLPVGGQRWIAYVSNETGTPEIYLQRFTPGQRTSGERLRVSVNGGTMPRWRRDGKELYYLSSDGRLMMAPVILGPETIHVSTPVALFPTSAAGSLTVDWSYDAASDGQRFLMIEPDEDADARSLTLFTNWLARTNK